MGSFNALLTCTDDCSGSFDAGSPVSCYGFAFGREYGILFDGLISTCLIVRVSLWCDLVSTTIALLRREAVLHYHRVPIADCGWTPAQASVTVHVLG